MTFDPRHKSRALLDPILAIGLLEERRAPVRNIGPHGVGRIGEAAAGRRFQFGGAEQRRRELVAVKRIVQRLRRLAPFEQQRAEADGARCVLAEEPAGRAPSAQRVVDDVADRRAVAAAGKAVRQTPIAQGVGHRTVPPADVLQYFDGRRQPSAQSHPIFHYLQIIFRPALKAFPARIETVLFRQSRGTRNEDRERATPKSQTDKMKILVPQEVRNNSIST